MSVVMQRAKKTKNEKRKEGGKKVDTHQFRLRVSNLGLYSGQLSMSLFVLMSGKMGNFEP